MPLAVEAGRIGKRRAATKPKAKGLIDLCFINAEPSREVEALTPKEVLALYLEACTLLQKSTLEEIFRKRFSLFRPGVPRRNDDIGPRR
jgi:hypothetical protein